MLLIFRPLVGLGAGLVLACGNATIANARNPERISGLLNMFFTAFIIFLMFILPWAENIRNLEGVFTTLMVIMILLVPLLMKMPRRATAQVSQTVSQGKDGRGLLSMVAIAIFIVFFSFTLRDSMGWGFVERIGAELGYSITEVGYLLSLSALFGLLGPLITTIVGFRAGIKLPLIFGIIFAGLTTTGAFLSVNIPSLYVISLMFWTAAYFFGIAYLTAYAAKLDASGRIVAASGSAMVLGVAAGPALSGYLITYGGGYIFGAYVVLAVTAVMLVAILLTFKGADNYETGSQYRI
jgi:MFS family permease